MFINIKKTGEFNNYLFDNHHIHWVTVAPDTVLMTNYAQFDSKMAARFKRSLKPHFKRVKELKYKVKHPNKDSWAYINWLQTDKVLILPKFNIPEDEQAFHQIERVLPEYEGV